MPDVRKLAAAVIAPLIVLLTAPGVAAAGPSRGAHKVDRAVRESLRAGAATQTLIVTVKPGYRAELRRALKQHGDTIKSEHPLIDALTVEMHSSDVDELANQPWVEAISADALVQAKVAAHGSNSDNGSKKAEPAPLPLAGSTLRETLGLPRLAMAGWPSGATGVAVAIVDSGIAPSEDFTGRITGFYDFTKGGVPVAPFDDYGHGTHIAGLIGASGQASNFELQGIAPDVHLVGFKVLDSTGVGKTSDVIKALEYITANKDRLNVKIVNLSLGHPVFAPAKDDPLVRAVEQASAAGLIVVTSAGNFGQSTKSGETGYTGVTSPGNAPSAITVGATKTSDTITRLDDVIAGYSSRGPTWFDAFVKPDVVAPGHQLTSDAQVSSFLYKLLTANRGRTKNGVPVLKLSGTSMAAGVTSGVVALMIQAHNQNGLHNRTLLTPNLVKALLQFSAIPVQGADYLTQGAGEINAAGAIALAKAIDTDVRAGSAWLGIGVTPSSTIGGASYDWSRHVIWGDRVLSGDVVYTSNVVWGTGITWGTNVVWGTSAFVVGDNVVWGTVSLWGTHLVWSNRILGLADGDNVVWGTSDGDNVVWGTMNGDNVVWGTWSGDNVVWGTFAAGDNVVWGTFTVAGSGTGDEW